MAFIYSVPVIVLTLWVVLPQIFYNWYTINRHPINEPLRLKDVSGNHNLPSVTF